MNISEKIRAIRHSKGWSQEAMAEKLEMSVNGYAHIERGETDVQISRLKQIADTFGIELIELFDLDEQKLIHSQQHMKYDVLVRTVQDENRELQSELEKCYLLLAQKEKEITYLEEIIRLMKSIQQKDE